MEATSRALDPVVIGQDEGSELHVQPVLQSGRRQIDIRLWRRGPSGFAPSRNALTVDGTDLAALYEGISELLQASHEGRRIARVVWDRDEGRRLRAETEPFGTRFMARLGFWQRVRDTWRPADDGLVIAAHLLRPLLEVLSAMRARFLEAAETDLPPPLVPFVAEHEHRWPVPGADWITLEPDRIAFHPRGVRITAAVSAAGETPRLVLRQWRRQESVWLPEGRELSLTLQDVDALLAHLHQDPIDLNPVPREGYPSIRLRLDVERAPVSLVVEEEEHSAFVSRLSVPSEYLPRVGRLLAQCGALLVMHLSLEERAALLSRPEGPVVSAEIVDDALAIVEPEPKPEAEPPPLARPPDPEPEPEPAEPTPTEPERRVASLGEIQLSQQVIGFNTYLLEGQPLYLALHWDGGTLAIPIGHVARMLEDLRGLYYEALRGRRGHVSTVPGSPATHMSIHSHDAGIYVMLDQESGDRMVTLLFPVREVPTFLNAADAALRRIRRGDL